MAHTIDQCFSIDYNYKKIYNTSGYDDVFTTRALYSYLQDTFDDLAQLDDTVPMSAQTPTDFTFINGWFIDDTSIKYLKGGAITTSGWASGVIRMKAYDATGAGTAFSSGDIGKTITETDSGNTGVLLAYDQRTATEKGMVWIRPVDAGDTFADIDSPYTVSGGSSASGVFTAASVTGETIWPNVYTLGSIDQTSVTYPQLIYIIQNKAHISEWWPDPNASPATRQIDVLIKTQEMGTAIDSGNLTIFLRHYPADGTTAGDVVDLYDNFALSGVLSGRNAVPLATANDLNNTTNATTVGAYTGIVIAFINGTITRGAFTIGTAYTALEVVNQASSGASARFISDATGTLTLANITGIFDNSGAIVGATSGSSAPSTGTLTLNNDTRVTTKAFNQGDPFNYSVIIDCGTHTLLQVYEYLKNYTKYGATGQTYMVQRTATLTYAVNALDGEQYIEAYEDLVVPTNTFSPVKQSPFGTFAGGKLFGAKGVWIQNMAGTDVQAFQLIDSAGATHQPPVQIAITVTNTCASDRVAVFATTSVAGSTTIWKEQFSSHATSNITNSQTFVITGSNPIPSDTPTAGSIRIIDVTNTGPTRETRYTYTTWTGSTFSGITATLGKTYETGDTAYVPYLDTESSGASVSTTVIYSTDRFVLARVRRYTSTPILPFEAPGTIISTGYSQSTIRTTDTIVQ